MQKPFISIIIPVFKPNKDLDKCLESINKQDFKDYEILIIERISNHTSTSQLTSEQLTYSSKIITTTEPGIYKAMNIGIDNAQGKWLLFLGQDDQLANNLVLSKIFQKVNQKQKGIALGSVNIIHKNSWLIPSNYQNKISPLIYFKNTLHHQGILYHANIFKLNKFDEKLSVLADYKLNLELILSKIEVYNLPFQIALCNGSGVSKKFTKQLYKEEKRIKKALFPTLIYFFLAIFITIKQFIKINFGKSSFD